MQRNKASQTIFQIDLTTNHSRLNVSSIQRHSPLSCRENKPILPRLQIFPVETQTRFLTEKTFLDWLPSLSSVHLVKKEEESRCEAGPIKIRGSVVNLALNPWKSHHVSNFPEIKRLDPWQHLKSANWNASRHQTIDVDVQGFETTLTPSFFQRLIPKIESCLPYTLSRGRSNHVYPSYRAYQRSFFTFSLLFSIFLSMSSTPKKRRRSISENVRSYWSKGIVWFFYFWFEFYACIELLLKEWGKNSCHYEINLHR